MASAVFSLAVVLTPAVLVSGCVDARVNAPVTQFVSAQSPTRAGGVWNGIWTNDLTGDSVAVSGVVREDNEEGRFVTESGPLFRLQDIAGTEGDLSATIAATTSTLGETFEDGSISTSGVLTGFVVERTSMEGDWSFDSGETGTITLEYDGIYERGSDIAHLVGIWECSIGTICNIDELGEIFGQGEGECVATGRIEIIDPSYNVYEVNYGSPCMLGGILSGLGVLADQPDMNDAFIIMLDPVFFFYTDIFIRQ